MPTQPANIFIVQTAESSRSGKPKGSNISLINKQSALYKYRQQKKQRENRASPGRGHPLPGTFDAHRNSWLLESRLPNPVRGPDDALTDEGSSPEEDHTQLLVAFREDRPWINEWEYDEDEDARLHNCYAGLRTDPFYCMPIEDSSVVLSVSDLYTNMMIPHLSQTARVFNVQNVYLDIFWQMVFHEDTIDTVVAMSYCADASWRKPFGFVPNKYLFIHHGKALAKLRWKLSNLGATNTGIIVCMLMYNTNIARFLGNFKAAKQHMSMLRHILKNNPYLESLGFQGKLRSLLLQWDYFLTVNNGEEPLVPARGAYRSEYPSLPLSDEISGIVKTLPLGFKKLVQAGRLSCQVLELLGRAQEMVDSVAAGTTKAFLATPNENPYPDYRAAVPCLDAIDGGEAGLERLISFAIFLLTSRLLSPVKTAIWSLPTTGSRTLITQQALNCQVDNEDERHCLIWLWLVGIDSWGVVSGTVPEKGQELMQQLKSRFPKASNWRYLSDVVKEFFWTDDLESSCERYWHASNS